MRTKFKAPIPSEHSEQVALVKWLELESRKHPELALCFAVPNGARTSMSTARKLKAEGLRRGCPDLFWPVSRGLAIELKKAKGGRVSPEQKWWLNALNEQGYLALVCHGWQSAKATILQYLNLGLEARCKYLLRR